MDLNLKPEHKAFADEVRAFARANLSPATKAKTFSGKHYDKDDHIQWQQALGKKGWLAYTWPKKYGGPGFDVTQRFLFENVLAEEGAPRIIPFGVKMVGPEYAHLAAPRYFNNRKTTIYGGSNEIQKGIISKMVLGL